MGLKVKDPNGEWRSTGGGGKSNLLVVTLKTENGEYVSSHTYQEIKAFVESGGDVALCVEGSITSIFSLATISDTHAFFGKQAFVGRLFISQGYHINADGTVTLDQQMIEIPDGSGGGVSDWNDLENRPFYDNPDGSVGKQLDDKYLKMLEIGESRTDIVPEQELVFTLDESSGIYSLAGNALFNMVALTAGETYKVLWGETIYECAAKNATFEGLPVVGIGNAAASGGENTGEPFCFFRVAAEGTEVHNYCILAALDGSSAKKVSVYQTKQEGYKIKPSYIPDALFTEIDKRIEDYINEALGGDY